MSNYMYKAFNAEEDIIIGSKKTKTFPIWTDSPVDVDVNPEAILDTMWTQSAEMLTAESNYYYNVYNQDTASNANADAQFSIAFGTTQSIQLNVDADEYKYTYPSRAIYGQYVNILKNGSAVDTSKLFKISDQVMNPIYVISISRARIKDELEVNTWQLNLSGSLGVLNLVNTPLSAQDSEYVSIVTGKLDDYVGIESAIEDGLQVGILYPSRGLFILDATKIHSYVGSAVPGYNPSDVTGSASYNPSSSLNNIYEMMKYGNSIDSSVSSSAYFRARTIEVIRSTHYFCRIKNFEFNYSTNPSWVSGSDNEIVDDFYSDPKTFITTVGLYDGDSTSGQLVAVAKLSRPIPKDSETEALLKIRLDF